METKKIKSGEVEIEFTYEPNGPYLPIRWRIIGRRWHKIDTDLSYQRFLDACWAAGGRDCHLPNGEPTYPQPR